MIRQREHEEASHQRHLLDDMLWSGRFIRQGFDIKLAGEGLELGIFTEENCVEVSNRTGLGVMGAILRPDGQ